MERKVLDFGRKYSVGNYIVIKKVRSLNKRELRELREQSGIPKEVYKHLDRGGVPYITVETVSGSWSVSYVCGLTTYALIDRILPMAVGQEENPVEGYKGMTLADFHHLFNMWYTDTAVTGDREYQEDKARALQAFIARRVPISGAETAEQKAEDDKALDELRIEEEAKATIIDMAETLKEGGDV